MQQYTAFYIVLQLQHFVLRFYLMHFTKKQCTTFHIMLSLICYEVARQRETNKQEVPLYGETLDSTRIYLQLLLLQEERLS